MQQDLVDLSLSNAFSIAKLDSISIKTKSNSAILIDLPTSQRKAKIHFYNGCSQNGSSCASILSACAKTRSEVQRHVKFIVELISEGAWNALNTLQTFAEEDQAAPQNANLKTTNGFRQGAMSHFYDDHLRRLIVEYQTKISLHLSENFEILCEGEWEQSQQLTRIFDNDSNAAISQ